MLTAQPRSIFSWSFTVYDGGDPLAEVDLSWFRERGSFHLAGHEFDVLRTSMLQGEFALHSAGITLATARKISPLLRSFEVCCQDRQYDLKAFHPFTRQFGLYHDDRPIGSIRPLHLFTRKAQIDLPQGIVLPVRIFMFWLVLILWRRAARSSSSGGS